jgi:hypothetical protein
MNLSRGYLRDSASTESSCTASATFLPFHFRMVYAARNIVRVNSNLIDVL